MAVARTSADCAPETAKACAKMKNGTPETPMRAAASMAPCNRRHVILRFKPGCDGRRIEPGFARDRGEDRAVADVAALDEIGLEQGLLHRVLHARLAGPVDHAMRIERVDRAGDALEVEIDPLRPARLGQPLVHRVDRSLSAELLGEIGAAVEAARRNAGIELEGMPAHDDIVVGAFAQRGLEPALADVAPGTDDVGDDVDDDGSGGLVRG